MATPLHDPEYAPHRSHPDPLLYGPAVDVRLGDEELVELVADHVLRDVDRNELLAVVHGDRVSHHRGDDRRASRPGLHDLALVAPVHLLDVLEERILDVRALRDRTCHPPTSLGAAL